MMAAGVTVWQDCAGEGTALFNPDSPDQVKLAIRAAGIKAQRVTSQKQAEALAREASPLLARSCAEAQIRP